MDSQATTETVEMKDWVVRYRMPPGEGPHPVALMLHGWTGDENAMWIFATRLPQDTLLIAPRGIYPAALGGYGWQTPESRKWPAVEDFHPAVQALLELLSPVNFPQADFSNMRMVGFSQGAALVYMLALTHAERVRSLAGLSGFMPEGAMELASHRPLQGKAAYMAHGLHDKLVPVERARQAAEVLRAAGAYVAYCEDNVGHKLGLDCFRGMQAFFERY